MAPTPRIPSAFDPDVRDMPRPVTAPRSAPREEDAKRRRTGTRAGQDRRRALRELVLRGRARNLGRPFVGLPGELLLACFDGLPRAELPALSVVCWRFNDVFVAEGQACAAGGADHPRLSADGFARLCFFVSVGAVFPQPGASMLVALTAERFEAAGCDGAATRPLFMTSACPFGLPGGSWGRLVDEALAVFQQHGARQAVAVTLGTDAPRRAQARPVGPLLADVVPLDANQAEAFRLAQAGAFRASHAAALLAADWHGEGNAMPPLSPHRCCIVGPYVVSLAVAHVNRTQAYFSPLVALHRDTFAPLTSADGVWRDGLCSLTRSAPGAPDFSTCVLVPVSPTCAVLYRTAQHVWARPVPRPPHRPKQKSLLPDKILWFNRGRLHVRLCPTTPRVGGCAWPVPPHDADPSAVVWQLGCADARLGCAAT